MKELNMKELNIDNLIFENSNIDIFVNNIIETKQDIFKYPTINFEYNKDSISSEFEYNKDSISPEFEYNKDTISSEFEYNKDTISPEFEYNKDTVIPEFREHIIELNKLVRKTDGNIPNYIVAEDYKKTILNETIDNAYRLGLENFNKSEFTEDIKNVTNKVRFTKNPFKWFINLFKSEYRIFKEVDEKDIIDNIIKKIVKLSYYIAADGRYDKGDKILVNARIGHLLQTNPKFIFIFSEDGGIRANSQIYKIGSIYGIEIYINTKLDFDNNRILIWRKNNDNDPGLNIVHKPRVESFQHESINGLRTENIKTYKVFETTNDTYKQFFTLDLNIPKKKKFKERFKTFLKLK